MMIELYEIHQSTNTEQDSMIQNWGIRNLSRP